MSFADQMKNLAAEAEQQSEDGSVNKSGPDLLQMLRPLVLGMEALARATGESTSVLMKLEAAATAQQTLPQFMTSVQENMDDRHALNQELFNALHQELKGYKDDFLLEVMYKPIIRDVITLFDDLTQIHQQLNVLLKDQEAAGETVHQSLRNLRDNIDHKVEFVVELLARMGVTRLDPMTGKLDKAMQRAVAVEMAASEEEDSEVVGSLKPGFGWRERVIRPEEVVIKKWKDGFLVPLVQK